MGSGYAIRRGADILVFTAAHVVKDVETCQVRLLDTGYFEPAKVVWRDDEADVAVLEVCLELDLGPEPRWAVCEDADVECSAVGFPSFTGSDSERFVGRLSPDSGRIKRRLHLIHARPRPPQDWKGFSGAGLFADNFFVGVVTKAADDRLHAWPVARLVEDAGFVAATGLSPMRLEAHVLWPEADRGAVDRLDPWHALPRPTTRQPTQLLQARFGVVPFDPSLRELELEHLERFTRDDGPALMIVTGEGGSGKTRLLLEWCKRQRRQGWLAGFVNLAREDIRRVAQGQTRRLLVVDYAETQLERVVPIIDEMVRSGRPTTRLVLLARRRGAWVDRLQQDNTAAGLLMASSGFSLRGLNEAQFRAAYDAAYEAFGGDEPLEARGAGAHDERPLITHMRALLAVLDESEVPERAEDVLGRVLNRERKFWQLRLKPELHRDADRVGAALVLVDGIDDRTRLPALVQRVAGQHGVEPLTGCFAELYSRDMGVVGVEPDLLGEQLVLETLGYDEDHCGSEMLSRWLALPFEAGSPRAVGQSLTVLTRLARRSAERARGWLLALLRHRGRALITAIHEARVAIDPPGPVLADAIHELGDLQLALALAEVMPNQTIELREVAHVVVELIVAAQRGEADDDQARVRFAGTLNTLGIRLRDLGQLEEALAATQEAIDICRAVSEKNGPKVLIPTFSASLNNLGTLLMELGRPHDALVAAQQAVELSRDLAKAMPEEFREDFAGAFINLGVVLSELRRWHDALVATQEAVDILRELAKAKPSMRPPLAIAVNNLGIRLNELDRHEEALTAAQEAVALYRDLADEKPDAFRHDYATSLGSLALRLDNLGRSEDALEVTREAVNIERMLAEVRPGAFLPALATRLNNLGNLLGRLERQEAALAVLRETIEIRRRLAEANPVAFLNDLAGSLCNLGGLQGELGQWEDALATTQEAVEIQRRLAEVDPAVYLHDLAFSIGAHANVLLMTDQPGRAADLFAEGLRHARRLAETQPGAADLVSKFARHYRAACIESNLEIAEDLAPILAEIETPSPSRTW